MADSPLLTPDQKMNLTLDMQSPALVLGGVVANAPQPLPSALDHTTDAMIPDPMLPLELPGIRKVTQGEQGIPGMRGARGLLGNKGNTGLSAYEDWLRRGNAGSFEEFLGAIGGGLNLEDFRNGLVNAVKDLINPTLNAQLQQLVAMQLYLDTQILNARQEALNAASSLADQITQEQLARADAILAERMRMDANIQTEAYARQDADQSVVAEIKSYTSGYEGFSAVYSWNFYEDAAGWINAHGQPLTVIDAPSTNNHGWGYTPLPDSTPLLKSPTGLNLNLATSDHVRVRIRKIGSPAWHGALATETGTVLATLPEPEWNDQQEATLSFKIPDWAGASGICLLIQQDEAIAGKYFMYRYVAIGNTMPAASSSLVHKEVSLLSNAVQSVANDQTLLAAQFRGDYTGNDINAVTEGLLFQERQARATRDAALTQDVVNLHSRLNTGDIASAMSLMRTNINNLGDVVEAESERLDDVSVSVGDMQSQVTQQAQAIASTDGKVRALHSLTLNVNGHISGTVSENNGTTSSFSVLADVFRVFSSALQGFEIQNGYQRNYSAGAQLVMGHNFGVNNDLVLWYGPNIGAAACTKGNATIWFDKAGNAYFGGSLSAGVLRNGAQSTQIGSGASVTTGQFGTNGNAKVVTYSLSYENYFITQSNLGGSETLNATMILERSIGGGAWAEVSRRSLVGDKTLIEYEPGVGYSYSYGIGGSGTFTDNTAGSTSTFNYRVRLEGVTGWPYLKPENGQPGTQSLTVLSIEE